MGKIRKCRHFPLENLIVQQYSSGKSFVGEDFRHQTKISLLFPDEVCPGKVILILPYP